MSRDIDASHGIDISRCETVCLALGPYRNLTTLTAATLFLHPHCQVLNHAGARVYSEPRIDFLRHGAPGTMDRFLRYAIHISAGGERGDHGGSILHSHAFDPAHGMMALFTDAGGTAVKPSVRCLFWKESLLTSNLLRERNVDCAALLAQEPRLRFLLPVRNPLDCAVSNLRSGHVRRFHGLGDDPGVRETAAAVLEEVCWFARWKASLPERFFWFFEHSIDRDMLVRLAAFLRLEALPEWIRDALAAMKIKSGYAHDPPLLDWYRGHVARRFAAFPELGANLLRFAPR